MENLDLKNENLKLNTDSQVAPESKQVFDDGTIGKESGMTRRGFFGVVGGLLAYAASNTIPGFATEAEAKTSDLETAKNILNNNIFEFSKTVQDTVDSLDANEIKIVKLSNISPLSEIEFSVGRFGVTDIKIGTGFTDKDAYLYLPSLKEKLSKQKIQTANGQENFLESVESKLDLFVARYLVDYYKILNGERNEGKMVSNWRLGNVKKLIIKHGNSAIKIEESEGEKGNQGFIGEANHRMANLMLLGEGFYGKMPEGEQNKIKKYLDAADSAYKKYVKSGKAGDSFEETIYFDLLALKGKVAYEDLRKEFKKKEFNILGDIDVIPKTSKEEDFVSDEAGFNFEDFIQPFWDKVAKVQSDFENSIECNSDKGANFEAYYYLAMLKVNYPNHKNLVIGEFYKDNAVKDFTKLIKIIKKSNFNLPKGESKKGLISNLKFKIRKIELTKSQAVKVERKVGDRVIMTNYFSKNENGDIICADLINFFTGGGEQPFYFNPGKSEEISGKEVALKFSQRCYGGYGLMDSMDEQQHSAFAYMFNPITGNYISDPIKYS